MRILLLSQFIPPTVGGTEQHVWTLGKTLAAKGHEITLLSLATGSEEPPVQVVEDMRVVRVASTASRLPGLYSDPSRPFALPIPDPSVVNAVRRELSRERFDLVHAHNWIVNSALGPAARARVPVVVTLHEYSHVCATVRLMEHGVQPCQGPAPRSCLACATSHYGPIRGPVTVAANAWAAGRRAKGVAHAIAVSQAVADAVTLDPRSWLGGSRLDIEVIPNFIPDALVLEAVPARSPESPLLFVGAVNPDKGVPTLLDAYRQLDAPPALVLAGRHDPEYTFALPDGVRAAGPLPYDDVQSLMRSAFAVLVPSVWAEPFGMVVLEAMAAGKPVIAAASGGISEVVADGVTGLLVPPGNAPALAQAIRSLLDDPQLVHRLGRAAQDRARAYTVSSVIDRIERMYADVIAKFESDVMPLRTAAVVP